MYRSIRTALLASAVVAIPAGTTWAATHPAPRATPTRVASTARHKTVKHKAVKKKASAHKSVAHSYTGPSVDMQWGPVQVAITVKGKRITAIQASAPTERARSAFINEQAVPLLRQEVLQAQSANIDLISGATMTSEAYDESLQAAVDAAHKAHNL